MSSQPQKDRNMQKQKRAQRYSVVILLIMALVLSACAQNLADLATLRPVVSATALPATATGIATGPIQIFFTDPTAVHAADYEGGPDEVLVAALDQARLTVDVAAYSLDLWSVRDALINAHKRGVVVRMVMESDDMDTQEVQQVMDAGIPVNGDEKQGLMHNKFMVIDRVDVWTGSMNYTSSGVYKDNNNLIHIHSSQVGDDYSNEFNQMFTYHLFGPDKMAETPNPKVNLDGTPVDIYFSPEDKPAKSILTLIQAAQTSINFLAYEFTSNDIGAAMLQRAQAGVSVTGVMDEGQVKATKVTELDPFKQAGLDVRLDGNLTGLMHHMVIIIDQEIVITGSYIYTAAAETTNDENVVIIFSPLVAAQYMQEFQRVYALAQQP
jgi:phosphatidylserine/phosphatidylglycerophosphate/cardiolipin synthase-like enzyme